MKHITSSITQEWEKIILYLSCIMLVILTFSWLADFGQHNNQQTVTADSPANESIFDPQHAFAFLNSTAPEELKTPHIFTHNLKQITKPPPKPKPKPTPKPKPKPIPKPKSKPKPVQTPPTVVLTIRYLGTMTTPSGQSIALIENTKKGTRHFLKAGDTINGIQVKKFTADALTIKVMDNQTITIPFGQQKSIESK